MISNYLLYNPNPYNYKGPNDSFRLINDDIITETLIERFFDEFEKDLLYKNEDDFFDKLNSYLNKEGLIIFFIESHRLDARISNNTLYVEIPDNVETRSIAYVILHELSHYITNKSSNDKLKEYLNNPNNTNFNLNDIDRVGRELKYFLTPGEAANWAFTLSIYFYENKMIAGELYSKLKMSIPKSDYEFKKDYNFQNLPDELKTFYHIILYYLVFKKLSKDKQQKRDFSNMIGKFVRLIDKYIKRLKRIFLT